MLNKTHSTSENLMTIRVVGTHAISPIMKGCREHKAIARFQSENQDRNQKQYFALKLAFKRMRKSLKTSALRVSFTLSTSIRHVCKKEPMHYGVILFSAIFLPM
jgi:hypothetical protein